jgi:outer membrane receptor for ferrienterochelin and colicins
VVVNLIPRAPEGEGGVLTAGVGTLGFNRQHLLLYNGHRMRDWTFSLERSLRESYDLSTTFPDTDGDSYRRYNFAGTYNVRRGSDELRLRAEYFDEDSNGAGFSPPNLVRVLDADTQRWQAAISYKWSLGDCESLTLSNNYGSYEHDLERFFADFPETRQQTGFTDALWDTRLAWRYEGRTTWQAGVERSWDRIESDRIAVGEAESTRYGGYATAQWESGDWTFDAAARVDSHEEFGTAVSPKLAATLQLDEYSTLAFGAGMGYRAPSLRERYYEFASPFGYTVLGNPDLEPERSTSYTFDYNRATQRTRLALGAFHHDVENLITFTQTQAIPQVFMTENVTRARSTGFTVGTERRWLVGGCADCSPRWFGLGYDGTFLTESEDEELGTRLANAPRTDHRLRAFYRTPDYNAEAVLRALGSRYLDRENATQAPAYETLDLSFSHTVGDGTWRVAGLNVLDEKNGRFGPEPGRELRVEYTLEF